MTTPNNPYARRWRWWYSAIIDWMIANPGTSVKYCIKANGGPIDASYGCVTQITETDLFKSHLAQRKADFVEKHDFAVRARSFQLAEITSELMLEKLAKQRDKIPLRELNEVRQSALEVLGFGNQGPAVSVSVSQQNNTLNVGVSPDTLLEARNTIRQVEQLRRLQTEGRAALPGTLDLDSVPVDVPADLDVEEALRASTHPEDRRRRTTPIGNSDQDQDEEPDDAPLYIAS